MSALYPHHVDVSKPTFGGLRAGSHFVNTASMTKNSTPNLYREIGQRLIAIRKAESNLGQGEWAVKHGFNPTQYNNWETGVRRPTVDEAQRICDLYGLSLDFIYRGKLSGVPDKIKNLL